MNEFKKKKSVLINRLDRRSVLYSNKLRLKYDDFENNKEKESVKVKIDNITRIEEVSIMKENIKNIVENKYFNILVTFISIYSLYADDFKTLFVSNTYDTLFSSIMILIILIFMIEIILTTIVDENYLCDLYFYVDVISTISLLLDVHWIYAEMNAESSKAIVKFGKGGRLAARALRLLRFTKTTKAFTQAQKFVNLNTNDRNESHAGKKILELTAKRLYLLIIMLILALICFDISIYSNTNNKTHFSIDYFTYVKNHTQLNYSFEMFKYEMNKTQGNIKLLSVSIYNYTYISNDDILSLRSWEIEEVKAVCDHPLLMSINNNSTNCIAKFDIREQIKFFSIINISKTLFIIAMISLFSYAFNKDTKKIISDPINNMTKKITGITNNPIEAMLNETNDNKEIKNTDKYIFRCCRNKVNNLETLIIEKAISKIGGLLALGFGEAGSEIVAKNMKESGEGEINPMIEGKKVMAIYGFCDIRNFTDTTEELEEDVMIFVNRIGEIVHEIVNDNCGSANKNIGDAFLLVWKFDDRFIEVKKQQLPSPTKAKTKTNYINPIFNQHQSNSNTTNELLNKNTNNLSSSNNFRNILAFPDSSNYIRPDILRNTSLSPTKRKSNNDPSNKAFHISSSIVSISKLISKNKKNNEANSKNIKSNAPSQSPSRNEFNSFKTIITNFQKSKLNPISKHSTNLKQDKSLLTSKPIIGQISQNELTLINCIPVNQIVDMALISFAQIIINIHKSKVLDYYRHHEKLNKRIPNFCVKMGFGLHLGWSIEGAIGSTFKIDASYLSPHVNMSNKLEEGTKSYKVHMIMSDEFVKYLSKEARKRIRVIDRLKSHEDGKNYSLYTLDIDLDSLPIEQSIEESEDQMERYLRKRKERKISLIKF